MDKLEQFRKQLQQLQDGTLPEYLRRLKRIEQQYKERLRLNDVWKAYCVSEDHSFSQSQTVPYQLMVYIVCFAD